MAEKKKVAKKKPYKLPMVGGRPKKRLSRTEFEEMVRNMGARAARDYMRDNDVSYDRGDGFPIVPSRRFAVELSQRVNRTSPPYLPDDMSDKVRKDREVRDSAAETVRRATGMKKGGIVKAQPKRIAKKTAQPKKIAAKTKRHRS